MSPQQLKAAFPWLGEKKAADLEPAYLGECIQQIEDLYHSLRDVEMKPAVIKRGKLVCSKCGRKELPILSEHGYSVSHDLASITAKEIKARGWDGDSNGISEEGTHYTLECTTCSTEYALPEDMEITWL